MSPADTLGSPPAGMDPDTEKQIIEALLFVSDEPVTLEQIEEIIPGRRPEEILARIHELESEMSGSGRGLRIEAVAGGYRLATPPELAPWIRNFFRSRNKTRLSAASVETLAIVAYKQPVTAPEIQEIRGVDPQAALKTLLEKRLVRIAGKKKVVGRPFLYATTREFLIYFGLASLDDLPPIDDFERLAAALGPERGGEAGDADASATFPDNAVAEPWGEPGEGDHRSKGGEAMEFGKRSTPGVRPTDPPASDDEE